MSKNETIYNERTAIGPLTEGKSVLVKGIGNSMTPRLVSGQIVRVDPITPDMIISKGDIVLAKVYKNVYLHKVTAVQQGKTLLYCQIGNNHGHINGWTKFIYGKARDV